MVSSEFKSPGALYRGKPFWAWNGKLDPKELRRQIRVMSQMGLGGFFMHARVGLDTPYLSDDWFDCVQACVEQAAELDMEAWLYDEDRWPSGPAGGLVTRENPEFRQRKLAMWEIRKPSDFKWSEGTVAAYTATVEGAKAADVKRLRKGQTVRKLKRGQRILAFTAMVDKPHSRFNGGTYLDTLNPAAVREFIKVTHEAYRKRFKKDFGKRIPGIFTDEPAHTGMVQDVARSIIDEFAEPTHAATVGETGEAWLAPWTDQLPAVFRERYGYDLLDHLPEVFFDLDGKEVSQARYDFHDVVTHLFVESFSRQIGEWCGKNNLQYTGHLLCEATLSDQTFKVGAAMRFYEHMQAPGMDLLTQFNREYDTAKQVTSVARQFGRKWRLSEMYGCTGWDFPFTGHKALGDWQAALGINLRCHHLSWYTMEGQAKRDYPASMLHQSPWWRMYDAVESYYARINVLMSRGREVRDLLVIHPVESMWLLCKKGWLKDPKTEEYNQALVDLRDSLLSRNIDFDYGDEDILARHAKVTKAGGVPQLIVGRARYRAVVVPPMISIRKSTLRLLQTFKGVGGHVVFAGDAPGHVDAKPSVSAQETARICGKAPAKGKPLADAVEGTCRRVSIVDEKGAEIPATLHQLREGADAFYLFVCNTGYDYARSRRGPRSDIPVSERQAAFPEVTIRVFGDGEGAPLDLEPATGEIYAAKGGPTEGGWEFKTSLLPLGSRLFALPKKKLTSEYPGRPQLKEQRAIEFEDEDWKYSLSESNCLVLDRPRYRVGEEGKRRKADEILRVDNKIREELGIARRGGPMIQPWARPKPKNPTETPVKLYYHFEAKALPSGDLFLALERPELYKIAVNRAPVSPDSECGWWVDRSLRTVRLDPAILNIGDNEVTLECRYSENHPGLEAAYLLGLFGVSVKETALTLTEAPTALKLGDWTRQGLPFYSGSVGYMRTVRPKLHRHERAFVEVPEYAGAGVRVLVNGRPAGIIAWPPNEVEVTDLLSDGTSTLVVEVLGHRRNSHGPLHLSDKTPRWTGPAQFQTEGAEWTDQYQLVPCGLMKPPKLVIKK